MTDRPPSQFVALPSFDRPWEQNANSIWLASTLSLHRNIEKFTFPQKLDTEKRYLISKVIADTLKTLPSLSRITILPVGSIAPIDREFLTEQFLIFETTRDNQHGQDIAIEPSGTLLIQINANDHLELNIVDPSGELEQSLHRLNTIEREIEGHLPFSFSNHFGYMTSDPCRSGTGLVITAYLHIPALVSQGGYHQTIDSEKHEGLLFTSLQGNPNDLIGDLLVIKNRWTLGISEETILSLVRNTVQKIIFDERSARESLQKSKATKNIDQISRAIGTLQHSFTIDTSEALRALSQIKFGIELGWIQGMGLKKINELFFDCRRAHLAKKINPSSYASPQLYSDRAQYFREIMAGVSLNPSNYPSAK